MNPARGRFGRPLAQAAACAICGDAIAVPDNENAEDTLCAACAGKSEATMSRARVLVLAAFLVVYGLGWALLLANVVSGAAASVEPGSTVTYGAVARLPSSGGWRFLADGSHVTSGYTAISCLSNGALRVQYAPLRNVVTVFVSPDETLARRGVLAGASVGLTETRILFTRVTSDGPKPITCSSSLLRGDSANVWIGLVGTMAP
jgi:hypothetical protein